MSKAFVVRMVIWTCLVLYMLCDFYLFNGPLKRELRSLFPTQNDELRIAIEKGVCAKVYNTPIYLSQVNRRITETLWRNGRAMQDVKDPELVMLRWQALNDLIDEHLVRIKIRVNQEEVSITEAQVDAAVASFEKRFEEAGDLDAALQAQGIESRQELRYRLAAGLEQEQYVMSKIESAIAVTDEQALAWYEENKEELKLSERRHVRHVFLATLDRDPLLVKASMSEYFKRLKNGAISFEKLAADVSEDDRSKGVGGDLGWMTSKRVLPDFAQAAFSLNLNEPKMVQTKIGWHIIEVMASKPAEIPSFDSMKDEIITSLRDSERQDAVAQYRHQLRLLNHEKVDIYAVVVESL